MAGGSPSNKRPTLRTVAIPGCMSWRWVASAGKSALAPIQSWTRAIASRARSRAPEVWLSRRCSTRFRRSLPGEDIRFDGSEGLLDLDGLDADHAALHVAGDFDEELFLLAGALEFIEGFEVARFVELDVLALFGNEAETTLLTAFHALGSVRGGFELYQLHNIFRNILI